jgi:ADP-ribose pyrophosphatase YjhB (NUDIX family)
VLKRFLFRIFRWLVPVSFNILNGILAGNLPPFGSSCAIVEDQGRFLLVKIPGGGLVFPGGFMRWRENPAETAQRECREETGLEVQMLDTIGTYATASTGIDRLSTLVVVFTGEIIGGALRGSIEGHPCWLNEADMRKKLDKHYAKILEDYFAYRQQRQALASLDTAAPDLTKE